MKPKQGYFRQFPTILSLVLVFVLFSIQPLKANEPLPKTIHYFSLLSGTIDPMDGMAEIVSAILSSAGSFYTLVPAPDGSSPLLVTCERLDGDSPSLLLAVDLSHVENAAWTLSVWLTMLERHIYEANSCSVAFAILPAPGLKKRADLEAGESFWLPVDPYQSLADLNPTSVILLDIVPEAKGLNLEAETRGRLTPLHILQTVRASLDRLGLAYSENVVKALYARAGLIDGSAGLIPFLELGVPAIRLYGQMNGSFELLPSLTRQYQDALGEDWFMMRDVNYLRYQLPAAVLSLDDVTITRVILFLLGAFMASVALRPLLEQRQTGSLGPGVLPEALVAFLFSFIAVSLSWLTHGFAARLFGSGLLSIDLPPFLLAIGILGRLGSTMLFFFTLSGLSARFGLLPHAVRGTASQASAMIAGILGMSILYSSIQGSLILFGTMILLSLAGINAAVAVLSISALVILLFPMIFSAIPVFIPGLVTILNAQGIQLFLLAGFTAPVALWVLTTLSPRHRLVRGDRTAPYLIASALVLCFLDPWLRARL